ncbi:MAG TPA: amidohydrolase family protein, partial [Candidatus Limnocylindrales bacterium]|nr:amidohydrolase family protein [Candidatus Limnocylindrales bacterium]
LPGVVDPHTHFMLNAGGVRTADDFASASRSAAAGGVTTYLDFAPQQPGETFLQTLDARRRLIDGQTAVDYGMHLNINRLYPGWERDLERLVEAGVTSAKIYTTYRDDIFYMDDWTWYRLMERAGGAGLLVQVHAENDAILEGRKAELAAAGQTSLEFFGAARPAIAETEAVARALTFSRSTGSPVYLVHLSVPDSVDLVGEARRQGVRAVAETCPHFLVLDESVYGGPQPARFTMTPPLRDRRMVDGLWEQLRRGSIATVGSDHCGFSLASRAGVNDFTRVSPGVPGVETSLLLLYTFGVHTDRIDLATMVRVLCENPARVFGLWGVKGDLAPGFDADVVLFDPEPARMLTDAELHSAAGFSPYEGLRVKGRVRMTISRGEVIYRDGVVLAEPGRGHFLRCAPFDPVRARA